ncbi:substrate-binding domain-containing protein [Yoonia sp. SS1-5]|uniref:Substrate-binding domain-containing protein n=1 Tax=Yoonia rhodophyticola TaxID=3137370 RepID=A0AAN0MAA5_9RHOB
MWVGFATLGFQRRLVPLWAVCFACLTAQPLGAQQVVIREKEGTGVIAGRLLPSDTSSFMVQTTLGVIRIAREDAICEGLACPQLPDAAPIDIAPAIADTAPPADPIDPAQILTDVRIAGSRVMSDVLMPFLVQGYAAQQGASAPRRIALADQRMTLVVQNTDEAAEPRFVVEIEATDAGAGLASLQRGDADLAMMSRQPTQTEVDTFRADGLENLRDPVQNHVIAFDRLEVIVSPDNPVQSLALSDLQDLLSGKIANWASLGGPDVPVAVFAPKAGADSQLAFSTALMGPAGLTFAPGAVAVETPDAVARAIAANPGGIGVVPTSASGPATPVSLTGNCGLPWRATPFAIKAGDDPLRRPLRLLTSSQTPGPETRGLLDFATSPAADILIRQAGFIGPRIIANPDPAPLPALDGADPARAAHLTRMRDTLGEAVRLSTTFRFDGNASQADIARLIAFLDRPDYAGRQVILAGFSAAPGDVDAGIAASQADADAVRAAIVLQQAADTADRDRFTAIGFGPLWPIACSDTPGADTRNRRVEVWVR